MSHKNAIKLVWGVIFWEEFLQLWRFRLKLWRFFLKKIFRRFLALSGSERGASQFKTVGHFGFQPRPRGRINWQLQPFFAENKPVSMANNAEPGVLTQEQRDWNFVASLS